MVAKPRSTTGLLSPEPHLLVSNLWSLFETGKIRILASCTLTNSDDLIKPKITFNSSFKRSTVAMAEQIRTALEAVNNKGATRGLGTQPYS